MHWRVLHKSLESFSYNVQFVHGLVENDFLSLSKKLRRNTISDIMQIITTAAFRAREVKRELNQSYLILKKILIFYNFSNALAYGLPCTI